MSQDHNPFGGKNRNSLYVPMSDTEREFIQRLVESGELMVKVHGWGFILGPKVTAGDHQVMIPIDMLFDRPETPIPVSYFDLELCTQAGFTLFRERQPTEYGGFPLMVGSGSQVSMVWHIGVRAIDPNVIRTFMPGAHGLTSRRFDRDTGDLTLTGNMQLDTEKKRLLRYLVRGEDSVQLDRDEKLKA